MENKRAVISAYPECSPDDVATIHCQVAHVSATLMDLEYMFQNRYPDCKVVCDVQPEVGV